VRTACRLITGIVEVCARADLDVVVVESDEDAAKAGLARLEKSLARAASKGKIEAASAVLERLRVVTDLEALARELVIKAIVEGRGGHGRALPQTRRNRHRPRRLLASTPPLSRS
jgi:3-hydroxybutyryl-CoA dehydrogenase